MTTTRRALLGFFAGLPLAWKALAAEALSPELEQEAAETWTDEHTYRYRTRQLFFACPISPELFALQGGLAAILDYNLREP